MLTPELMTCHAKISNKKKLLEHISHLAADAKPPLKYQAVLESLQKRERLGSTAVGKGIAIPHARIKELDDTICMVTTLDQTIDFGGEIELNKDVDVIFSLLVPEEATEEHLKTLAMLSEIIKNPDFITRVRQAKNQNELYQIIMDEKDIVSGKQ